DPPDHAGQPGQHHQGPQALEAHAGPGRPGPGGHGYPLAPVPPGSLPRLPQGRPPGQEATQGPGPVVTPPQEPELREPDLPRTAKVRKQALRTGWTTGTCASAAATAAATALSTGEIQRTVSIGLPGGQRVSFPVDDCTVTPGEKAQAV